VFCTPPPVVGGGDDDDVDWMAHGLLSSDDGSIVARGVDALLVVGVVVAVGGRRGVGAGRLAEFLAGKRRTSIEAGRYKAGWTRLSTGGRRGGWLRWRLGPRRGPKGGGRALERRVMVMAGDWTGTAARQMPPHRISERGVSPPAHC
jgi:hypothetical protein